MELNSDFTIAWFIWGGLFAAIEGVALFNKREGDTLSEHVWKWFQVKKSNPKALALRTGLFGFMAWLTAHFVFGV